MVRIWNIRCTYFVRINFSYIPIRIWYRPIRTTTSWAYLACFLAVWYIWVCSGQFQYVFVCCSTYRYVLVQFIFGMYLMSICTYWAHIYGSVRSGTYCVYLNTYHYEPNLNYVPIRTSFICDNTYQYVSATKYVPIRTVIYIPIRTKLRTNSQIVKLRTPDWPKHVPHFPIHTTIDRNSHWWS